jgi:amino-acid N-acetyltransferase
VHACEGGVSRVHFISRHQDGALLQELFTHDGVGTMITQDPVETLRQARIEDVGGVLRLIEPLEADGTLVKRGRERLEQEIERFFVLEHDARIVGCAALYPFEKNRMAELACLAVEAQSRNTGAGERLLKEVEAQAKLKRIHKLFVLTTRAAHWFIERGFVETPLASLPEEKQALYNYQRRSKVFCKAI